MLVASGSIVKSLYVIKYICSGQIPGFVNALFDLLVLQVTEERLSHCVIPTVAPAAHARTQSVVFAPTVELIAAKVTAAQTAKRRSRYGEL